MITVPATFAARFRTPEQRRWLADLPELIERYLRRWELRLDGEPMHGYSGLVAPVLSAGRAAVLKVSWPHVEAQDEALALATWRGAGAVELLDHDDADFVLLLERLDSNRDLTREPIDDAISVAGGLLRRLSVPAPTVRRSLAEQAERWRTELPAEAARLGNAVPAGMIDRAVDLCRDMRPGALLINEDLHYLNVLRGTREPWLVIDPKVLTGDPEFCVIPLLRNRFDEMNGPAAIRRRLAAVVDAAELDPERAAAWTFIRAIDDWLYFLPESARDAEAAAEIASALTDYARP
ncbi:aminoglycoside phosphotransferase family protein [Nocardia vaccinii]|uniref:aminoglycoside phosphotransferase family protein n=1 Tax=Nocardia vaccinii TaxID=1822 RepID=UPI000A03CF12|nr:aminoglycoside phosphotransferase family protein [Nocardia vaccinii]